MQIAWVEIKFDSSNIKSFEMLFIRFNKKCFRTDSLMESEDSTKLLFSECSSFSFQQLLVLLAKLQKADEANTAASMLLGNAERFWVCIKQILVGFLISLVHLRNRI